MQVLLMTNVTAPFAEVPCVIIFLIGNGIHIDGKIMNQYRYYNFDDNCSILYLVNCTIKMNDSWVYIDPSRRGCISSSRTNNYLYFLGDVANLSDFPQSCRVEAQVLSNVYNISGLSTSDIYSNLLMGFQLEWIWSDPSSSVLVM